MNEDNRIAEIRAVLDEDAETRERFQVDVSTSYGPRFLTRIRAILDRPGVPDTAASAAFVVRDFCAERDGYLTAIKNCPRERRADYWRWQGHAEARRQLTERLAGTVDGPGVLS